MYKNDTRISDFTAETFKLPLLCYEKLWALVVGV